MSCRIRYLADQSIKLPAVHPASQRLIIFIRSKCITLTIHIANPRRGAKVGLRLSLLGASTGGRQDSAIHLRDFHHERHGVQVGFSIRLIAVISSRSDSSTGWESWGDPVGRQVPHPMQSSPLLDCYCREKSQSCLAQSIGKEVEGRLGRKAPPPVEGYAAESRIGSMHSVDGPGDLL